MSLYTKFYTLALIFIFPLFLSAQDDSFDEEILEIFGSQFFSTYFEYDFIEVSFDLEAASYIREDSDVAVLVYSEGENPKSFPIIKGLEVVENTERVFIKWNTFNDINSKEIIIQRSRDGILWKNLESIEPKGDYDEIANYHYVDYDPIRGTSFYRLKMTDFKGGSVMSSTKGVKVDNKGYVRCFPNPSTGIVSFFINSTEETDGILEVMNSQGILIHSESISVPEGSVALKRDFHHLKAGMYVIKLNFNSGLSFTQQEIFQD
ncbi:MAG: T9SS type A sorting domain-containing protein [Bacteroidota bacterium]